MLIIPNLLQIYEDFGKKPYKTNNTMNVINILTWNWNMAMKGKNHCILTVRTVMMNIWKFKMLIIVVNSAFIDLPSPSNIIMKFPLFALYLFISANEITADLFLAICCTWSTSHLYQYVNNLWIICSLHGNGSSMFFLSFIHVAGSLPCEFHTVRIMNIRISLLFL